MLKHTGGSKCCPHYSNPTMHAVLSHFKTENKSISVKQFNMVRGYCKRIQYFRMVCERCFVGEGPMGKGILVTCNGIIERPESQMIVKVDRTCKSRDFFFWNGLHHKQGFGFFHLLDTYEAGGVVVTDCLSVSVGFKYGVSLHDLVLQASLFSFGYRSSEKGSGRRDGVKREVGNCFCMNRGKVG